jgi:hypothetical protein
VNYDDYMMLQEQRRLLHDCDCERECDLCYDEECECLGHQKDCQTCKTTRGCRCDSIYDSWRDEQVRVVH